MNRWNPAKLDASLPDQRTQSRKVGRDLLSGAGVLDGVEPQQMFEYGPSFARDGGEHGGRGCGNLRKGYEDGGEEETEHVSISLMQLGNLSRSQLN